MGGRRYAEGEDIGERFQEGRVTVILFDDRRAVAHGQFGFPGQADAFRERLAFFSR
jgi:hypothetical protein